MNIDRKKSVTASAVYSTHLGTIEWDTQSELFLPLGLPGFDEQRRVLPVEIPARRPLVFLQCLERPDICFVALPVNVVAPSFKLCLSDDDRAALEFPPEAELVPGTDVLCLSLLLPAPGSVMVNLDAPIVINLHNFRCVQSVASAPVAGYYQLLPDRWARLC